jgi:phage-related protein
MKRITARFYRTAAGSQPVRNWLLDLPERDRKIVGRDIAICEFGWPIGMPTCRPIGNGLREVRSTIGRGKIEARVLFGLDGSSMILLHGHQKKPARQQADIATAQARWADYQRRKGH